jgi:hypothetical protein
MYNACAWNWFVSFGIEDRNLYGPIGVKSQTPRGTAVEDAKEDKGDAAAHIKILRRKHPYLVHSDLRICQKSLRSLVRSEARRKGLG